MQEVTVVLLWLRGKSKLSTILCKVRIWEYNCMQEVTVVFAFAAWTEQAF